MVKLALAHLLVRAGRHPAHPLEELERRHDAPEPHFNDSSYVCGRGPDGASLVFRAAFRTGKPDECWLGVQLPGGRQLLTQTPPGPRADGFVLGGLRWTCEEPGRRLRLAFDGPIAGERVAIDVVFEGEGPVVDFATVADKGAVARALAGHPWSRAMFRRLGETRAVHVEQGGRLTGTVTVGGEVLPVAWPAVRDHSWGRRDWRDWDRHLWIAGHLEDGRTFNVSRVRYAGLPELIAGFVTGDRTRGLQDGGSFPDLAGGPPRDHVVHARYEALGDVAIDVRWERGFRFDMDQGAYAIHEGMAEVRFGDVPGRGVAELGWSPRHG